MAGVKKSLQREADLVVDLPRGTFYFYIMAYIVDDYEQGLETEFLKILDQPLQVVVN